MADFDDLLNNSPEEEEHEYSKEEYAERKQTEREALYELSDSTALEVAADGGRFSRHLDVQARFDRYSAVNALLITAQMPEATRLGDYDYWEEKKGVVKSKSIISILEPGREYERGDGSVGVSYNAKKVFDISQIDTRKMKQTPAVNHDERRLLKALFSKYPMKITGVNELPDNRGAMTDADGSILVRKGMGFSDTFRAAAFEMACAEVSAGRELSAGQEFCAYSATYLLCRKYGVDTRSFSFDPTPDMFAGMDAQEIKGELSQIRDAAENIGRRMSRELDAAVRAANKSAQNREAR
jgi:hypothetical protein